MNLLVILLPLALALQPTPDKRPADEDPGWQKVFQQMAGEMSIKLADGEQPLTLRTTPVLRWSQPVRGGDDGATYLWLRDGRPEAIGALFAWPHKDGYRVVVHEFHSLSLSRLSATWKEKPHWSPEQAGIEIKPLPDAPPPATAVAGRLSQMRGLAREFSGNSIDRDDKEWELRLLPQPLYRYEIKEPRAVLDGALFTLVQGTDPEVILVVEARPAGAAWQWHYGCARFSDFELHVRHANKEVWTVPLGEFRGRNGSYVSLDAEHRKGPNEDPIHESKP